MEQNPQVPLRLVGICKTCHRATFGYLLHGEGPFICFNCATGRTPVQPAEPQPGPPSFTGPGYWTYTFTTSNSSGVDPNEQQH